MSTRTATTRARRGVRSDFRTRPLHAAKEVVRTIIPRIELRSARSFGELRDGVSEYVDELAGNADRALAQIGRFINDRGIFETIEHIARHLRSGSNEVLVTVPSPRPISGDHTVTADDTYLDVDASGGEVTVTLPPLATRIVPVNVRKADASSNKVIVAADGSETINGFSTLQVTRQHDAPKLFPGISEWGLW